MLRLTGQNIMELLKVYQIYFEESQQTHLERNYVPFFNPDCTHYFENSVIKKLIIENAHTDAEYFGVVSYQLRNKISTTRTVWRNINNIGNVSENIFSSIHFEQVLRKGMPDVMSFQKHIPHDPITFANQFHPNFSKYFKDIMNRIGYQWEPTRFEDVFYCQYFVAKSKIYEQFVNEMLIPAMDVMDTMPELMHNSNYPKPLPILLRDQWGIGWYPYHSFLCERMFSYFVHLNKLKCLHY